MATKFASKGVPSFSDENMCFPSTFAMSFAEDLFDPRFPEVQALLRLNRKLWKAMLP